MTIGSDTEQYQPPANGWRTFLILWATQSISVFGSALTLFAVTIWLTQVKFPSPEQQAQLALAVSAVSLAQAIPAVFAAPLAGAWADRHDRKRIMLSMDIANGCLSIVLFILIASGRLEMLPLIAIMALAAIFSAFHYASFDTSYAMIVPERQLPRANGMMQTMYDLSRIVSPAIAVAIMSLPTLARQGALPPGMGTLLARVNDGMALTIAVDAMTFFLAAAALAVLFIPSPVRTDLLAGAKRASVWDDIKIGALFIWQRPPLLWLLASFTVANLFGTPIYVFQPLIVKFNLAASWAAHGLTFEGALAIMNSLSSLGGVVGGIIVTTWGGLKTRRIYGVLVPMVIAAAAEVVFGLSSMLYLTVAMIFTVGVMIIILRAHTQAIWQTQTPREMQGRVFAVRRLIGQFTWPLGTLLAGWAGGLFDPGMVMAVMGSIFLVFSILQLFNPILLRVEDRTQPVVATADAAK